MLENSWNINIRITFGLPLQAHRYFVCPISESPHLRFILMKRFLSFVRKLELSVKPAVMNLVNVQSLTGSNIRTDTVALNYHPVSENNKLRTD